MGDFGFRYYGCVPNKRVPSEGEEEEGGHVVGAPTRAQSARLNDLLIIVSRRISLVILAPSERSSRARAIFQSRALFLR